MRRVCPARHLPSFEFLDDRTYTVRLGSVSCDSAVIVWRIAEICVANTFKRQRMQCGREDSRASALHSGFNLFEFLAIRWVS